MNEVMSWLNNGLAVVIIVVGYFGLVKVLKWLAANVITPVKDAILSHLTETTTAVKSLSESIPAMHADIKDIKESLPESCRFRP